MYLILIMLVVIYFCVYNKEIYIFFNKYIYLYKILVFFAVVLIIFFEWMCLLYFMPRDIFTETYIFF